MPGTVEGIRIQLEGIGYLKEEGLIVDFIRHLWCSQNGVAREKELDDRINPDRDWRHFDQETASRYYKRIGNLALMKKSKNEAGGNAKFSEKVKLYGKSEFKLTSGLSAFAEKGQWTTAAIDARQKSLATLAVQAWPNRVL
ncbi:MAG TPA: HNH endonuclease family protein [Bryobacteraceae bacterium]|nr:HNH endonuclease family protein [Bryobacteraceae bacterium]